MGWHNRHPQRKQRSSHDTKNKEEGAPPKVEEQQGRDNEPQEVPCVAIMYRDSLRHMLDAAGGGPAFYVSIRMIHCTLPTQQLSIGTVFTHSQCADPSRCR